jgi:large subunit ribosomal protein L17
MSSHRRSTQNFGRAFGPRQALIRGLMTSLVEHGRIKTTVDKAKECRRHIEKAITLGKKGDVATRRVLMSRLPNIEMVNKIVDDISKRFVDRPGGYTRVVKIGRRPGDTAEMAFLEFVDFDYEAKAAKVPKKEEKAQKKEESKARKLVARTHARHKKSVARMQKQSRAFNRA